jgi:translation initiation factor IF-3
LNFDFCFLIARFHDQNSKIKIQKSLRGREACHAALALAGSGGWAIDE